MSCKNWSSLFKGRILSRITSNRRLIHSRVESNRRPIQSMDWVQSKTESSKDQSYRRINPIEDQSIPGSRPIEDRAQPKIESIQGTISSRVESDQRLRPTKDRVWWRIVTNRRSCPPKIESIHASSLFEDRKAILDVGSQNLTHSNLTCKIVSVHSTRGSVGVIKDWIQSKTESNQGSRPIEDLSSKN